MSNYYINLQSVSVKQSGATDDSYSYKQSPVMGEGDVKVLRCSVSLEGMFSDEWYKVVHRDEGSFHLPANSHVVLMGAE